MDLITVHGHSRLFTRHSIASCCWFRPERQEPDPSLAFHLFGFVSRIRVQTCVSLGSLAKLPPRRYTAEVDLGRLWLWPRAEPLLLTSGPLASVEMTHVVGRHFFREYGVFTRFLIFSPAPSRTASGCTPGRQERTLIRITFLTNYSSSINRTLWNP